MRSLWRIAIVALFAVGVSDFAIAQSKRTTERPVEFRFAQDEPRAGWTRARVAYRAGVIYVSPDVQLDDRDIRRAKAVTDGSGRPAVQIQLTPSAVKKFNAMAKANHGKTLAIIVDGRIISTPVVLGEMIDDLLDITGIFTEQHAAEVAKSLSLNRSRGRKPTAGAPVPTRNRG